MWKRIEPKLRELGRRAGFAEVPAATVAAALVLCLLACGWALWRWWPAEQGEDELLAVETKATNPVGSAGTSAPVSPEPFTVHVVGAVRRPGVYGLPSGSRVIDAVKAAGGLLGDAVESGVNMARPVVDGEQIVVPDEDDPLPAAAAASGGAANPAGGAPGSALVDLNTADVGLLDTLPGVGPSTAEKIVADREANGPFQGVDDLGRVSGIGPKKLEQLRDLTCAN